MKSRILLLGLLFQMGSMLPMTEAFGQAQDNHMSEPKAPQCQKDQQNPSQMDVKSGAQSMWENYVNQINNYADQQKNRADGYDVAAQNAVAAAGSQVNAGAQNVSGGAATSGSGKMTQAGGDAQMAGSQAELCAQAAKAGKDALERAKKALNSCGTTKEVAAGQKMSAKVAPLATLESKCIQVKASTVSATSTFLKNAAIVGGIGVVGAGLGYGLTSALGDHGKDGKPEDAAKKACEATTGFTFKDGVCKSNSALADCPDGFVKDKDGYCVMTDSTGTAIADVNAAAVDKDKGVKITAPADKVKEMSAAEKALASLKNAEGGGSGSGAGASGSGAGGAGSGSGSGALGAAGVGSAGSGGSGSGGRYAASGSGSEEGEAKAGESGEAKENADNPLKWRNSKATDRDLPLSRRKRLSH